MNSCLGNSSENFHFLVALLQTKRFYLTRDNSLIQGSLDWPFSELFITFNIFSCRIWIISCKTFVITVTSNETINELIIYAILCQNVTIFYRQKLTSLSQVQEKLTFCRQSKQGSLSSHFIVGGSYIKIICLHIAVFNEHDILHFLR